jgi:NADH-quinone oxidoreductase subunit H
MFYLGEYVNTVTVAAIGVTLFLGGWRPFPGVPTPEVLGWLWPLLWFVLKVTAVVYVFIWIRGTLPRMRYDRLMNFGWKVLIPFGLFWVLATGAIVVLPDVFDTVLVSIGSFDVTRGMVMAVGLIVAVGLVFSLVKPLLDRPAERGETA